MSLWSRTSYFITWYLVNFIISSAIFFGLFNLRLVFRALDIITNESILFAFNSIALRLIIESLAILISFYFFLRNSVLLCGVIINVRRIRTADELLTSGGNSFGLEGEQGVGKTRTLVYSAMLLAENRAEDLCLKYSAIPIY